MPGATVEAPRKKGKNGEMVKNGRICVLCKRGADKDRYSWENDSRNPKNSGRPQLTPEQRERQSHRQRDLRAVARQACPNEGCGHSALKHGVRCEARDCNCGLSNSDVKGLWAQIERGELSGS